ncbi:relaxase/mobilization nuclease domain-containing protein [Vibrio cyclitrophicus]|uniref:relaxase/mobilization nuclease domain-containing protein n=1 Tax=Vibrio cyclitrophicus TaxID=47951 RepID=UPI000C85A9FF|nr:relaxase/mobilization nuclease domain-containing protein [Vibrio cyclitrophicus]PMG83921.1 hypothetical protein BCU82_21025 [Vibrio cyclitrophicus]
MIGFECKPKETIQTAKDVVQMMRYVSRSGKGGMEAAVPLEIVDDTELNAKQMLLYSASTKEGSVSEFITSNEMRSADDMIFRPNTTVENWDDVIEELIEVSSRNDRCKRPLKHWVLSNPEGEDLANHQWAKVAEQFMTGLGYENCKWICFKHAKESNPHIHLIISRIDTMTNKVISDWKEHERSFPIIRQIEKDFKLTRLASPGDLMKPEKQENGDYIMVPNNSEQGNRKRPHANDIIRRLNVVHDQLFTETQIEPSLSEWMLALREASIGVQFTYTKDGAVKGISYRIKTQSGENFICSASKLGKQSKFGFKKIKDRLTPITDEQLNLAREISARETRMRDDEEKDIIAFKKLDDIRLLSKKVYDVQVKMTELHFSKYLLKILLKKRNFRAHRRNGVFVVSRRFEIKNLEETPRMTGPEYRAYLERKWAEMIIEKILKFFGFYTTEVQPPSLDIKFAEALLNGEYQNLFGFTNKQEYHPEGRKNVVIKNIDLEEHLHKKVSSGDGTGGTTRVRTMVNDLTPSL